MKLTGVRPIEYAGFFQAVVNFAPWGAFNNLSVEFFNNPILNVKITPNKRYILKDISFGVSHKMVDSSIDDFSFKMFSQGCVVGLSNAKEYSALINKAKLQGIDPTSGIIPGSSFDIIPVSDIYINNTSGGKGSVSYYLAGYDPSFGGQQILHLPPIYPLYPDVVLLTMPGALRSSSIISSNKEYYENPFPYKKDYLSLMSYQYNFLQISFPILSMIYSVSPTTYPLIQNWSVMHFSASLEEYEP